MSITPSFARMRLDAIELARSSTASPVGVDNAPAGSSYVGPNAVTWRKTGATSTAWTEQLLRAPWFNVKTYGAVGSGVVNDKAAIQSAISAAQAAGGGVVFFPRGSYRCDLSGSGVSGIPVFLLTGAAAGGILFLGEGRASKVWMYSTTLGGDRRLFDIRESCDLVGFKALAFDSDITSTTEQQHLLHWQCTSSGTTGRSFVEDCYFGYTRGDAIRFLGQDSNRVTDIVVRRCVAQMRSLTARTFVSWQRSSDGIVVDCSYNQDVSAIDFEPTGTGSLERNRIHRNILFGIVTLTGNDSGQQSRRSTFTNNIITEGSVSGLNVEYWTIAGNIVRNNEAGISDYPVAFRKRTHQTLIADNILVRGTGSDTSSGLINVENQSTVGDNYGLVIDGNLAVQESSTTSCVGVQLRDAKQVVCTNNMLFPRISSLASSNFIVFEDINDTIASFTVCGNFGIGLDQRMAGGVSGAGKNSTVSDNFFRHVNNGILIDLDPDGSHACAARNMLVTQSSGVSIVGTGAGYAIDGNAGGAAVYSVNATPEGAIAAPVGSIALRDRAGGGVGTTFYVKESGSSSTGWVAK